MTDQTRQATGVPGLDDLLGGGLLPGTLTAVVGAIGTGKTQLGLQFAAAGAAQEQARGIVFDMTCRGDSQSHATYAKRMFGWALAESGPQQLTSDGFFDLGRTYGEYLHVFDYRGRRQTERESRFDDWRDWQQELLGKLQSAIAFFYGNFVRGVRRAAIDGIDPADSPSESVQFDLFEYVYHQILRKDADWVARDLFRQDYRRQADLVAAHPYDPAKIGCLLLCTSAESLLDDLIDRPLAAGDWLANANTVIYLGRLRQGNRVDRGLYIAKHRGSYASESIVPYAIGEHGLRIL